MTLEESVKNAISLEKFTRVFNYLIENASLDHDIRNLMVLNGYNYDDISDNDIKDFIERWEKERPGEYTCFKIEQGISYCYNNLLKILGGDKVEMPSLENVNDKTLYSYYQSEVCNDLMKKFFSEEYRDDIGNEYFIVNFMKECRNYMYPENQFVHDEKFVRTIFEIFEKNKKYFSKFENLNELYDDEIVTDFSVSDDLINKLKHRIVIMRNFIEKNNVEFPGKDYFKIYDSSKEDENIKDKGNYNNKELISSVRILRDNGIELTKEQAEKLGIPILKSRERIDRNVVAAKEEFSFVSKVREDWQNDSNHVDNLRSDEIRQAQLMVDRLMQLDKENGLNTTQVDLLNGYIDFLKYSRDVNERNVGPMTDEVRREMQEFYFAQEDEAKRYGR